jgi:hypothetical protein
MNYFSIGNMITTSHPDTCALTALGEFASTLPTSTHLSRMIHTGVLLGIGHYAVILSVILGRQHTQPFRTRPAIYTHPDDYNDLVRKVFLLSAETDRGTHSEPIMLLKLFCTWRIAGRQYKAHMGQALDWKRIQLIENEVQVLSKRVNSALFNMSSARIDLTEIHVGDVQKNVDLLRLLLIWSADGNILKTRQVEPLHQRTRPEREGFLLRDSNVTPEKIRELFPEELDSGVGGHAFPVSRQLHAYEGKTFPALTERSAQSVLFALVVAPDSSVDAAWIWFPTTDGPRFMLATTDSRSQTDLSVLFGRLAPDLAVSGLFRKVRQDGMEILLCSCAANAVSGKQLDSALLMLFDRTLEVYFVPRTGDTVMGVRMLVKSSNTGCEALLQVLRGKFGPRAAAFTVEYVAPLSRLQLVRFAASCHRSDYPSQWMEAPFGMRLLSAYGARRMTR